MAHLSLYRKYRSQSFADLMGQDHVVRTLQNAISSGRMAHAFLFTGPRGTGKTSSARLLAKALNCEKGPAPEPCNECIHCLEITEGSSMDVYEMDAASEAGVDEVRERIVQAVEYQPASARYKIFIIDEVHDLSAKAFDALLKTIEEPPGHVIFILATTEYVKVPPTIRSRCQKFEFHRASLADLQKRLSFVAEQEGFEVDAGALAAIARMADGGFRDALTLLEQARLGGDSRITAEAVYDQLGLVADEATDQLLQTMKSQDVAGLINGLRELGRRGRDPRAILESLLHRTADLTATLFGLHHGLDATAEASAHALAVQIGQDELLRLRGALAEAHRAIQSITLPRLWLEAELIRISRPVATVAAPAAPVTRAVTQAAPPTVTPSVTPTAPAKPEPKPEPKTETKPEPATPAPISSGGGDPRWQAAFQALAKMSRTMGGKLQEAWADVHDQRVILNMPKKMHLDWVTDDPRRLGAVQKAVDEAFGQAMILELVHVPATRSEEPTAVELELQGRDLYEAAKSLFRGGSRPTDE